MNTQWVGAAVVGLVLLVPAFGHSDGPDMTVWRLRREVEERERQVTRAQRELAEARARVALAEGKRDLAMAELRKVVAGHQGEVQWIRDHANWFCDPRELMTTAQWDLAKARVRLAEMEGDGATLVAEWKKIVGFHEEQVERNRRVEQVAALQPEEKSAALEGLNQARQRLAEAEKKLAAEQGKKGKESK